MSHPNANNNRHLAEQHKYLILIALLLLTFAVYLPGINGRFTFDDYPQIYLNQNLQNVDSLGDFQRLWQSGNAGPGGRPIALITFAAQIAYSGLNPKAFKLTNVIIHLFNGVLVFQLITCLLSNKWPLPNRTHVTIAALSITAFWLLNPMGLTSVLYIVQRMNSLAATFSLIGLYIFAKNRERSLETNAGLWKGYYALLIFTTLSYLTKENGLLTIAYAYLIEAYIFCWKANNARWAKRLRFLRRLQAPAAILLATYVLANPNLIGGYEGRPFTLSERLLTESRILFSYAKQIVLPDISYMALYHDDIVLSKDIFSPPTTAISLIFHIVILTWAIYYRASLPLPTLGISWFYIGHSLESTIFPLELVFEHRNYLPMLGPILCLLTTPFYISTAQPHINKLLYLLATFIVALTISTTLRSSAWGNPLYPIQEAERNQKSARANFDATVSLVEYIKDTGDTSPTIMELANKFCRRSIENDPNAISPYILCLDLYITTKQAIPSTFFDQFAFRAESALIHPGTVFALKRLNDLLFLNDPQYTAESAEKIYYALLKNPRIPKIVSSHVLFIYGLMWGKLGDTTKRLSYIEKALQEKADILEFRVILVGFLIDAKLLHQAESELETLKQQDKFGLFHDVEISLSEQIKRDSR